MAAYESIPFELPPIPWIIRINCLQNPVSSKWVESRRTLTLLASSTVMAEGHTSLQARLVIHLSFCFQGGKLVPFYKCENQSRVSGSVMGPWLCVCQLWTALESRAPFPVQSCSTFNTASMLEAAGLHPCSSSYPHWRTGWSHPYHPHTGNFQMVISSPSSPLSSRCAHLAACSTSTLGYLRGILDTELNFGPFPHPRQALLTVILFSATGVAIFLVTQAQTLPHPKPNLLEIPLVCL